MLLRLTPPNLLLAVSLLSGFRSTNHNVFSAASPTAKPEPEPGLLDGIVKLVGKLPLNNPPPDILWTPKPSPQCAAVNGGELTCCQASLAGDLPLVVFLAGTYGYALNPNNVNGIYCGQFPVTACPGVKLCCQVTALNPLLSLYCQDPPL
ncbi:hypothetical protein MN608_09047 [Microdochium nivale]|nr:hypothetical protein MN608_09047 [Microdochium nivale]